MRGPFPSGDGWRLAMFRHLRTGFWLLLPLLASCQSMEAGEGYFSSPLNPGDEVEVRRPLVVPAGLARVYLQYGKPLGSIEDIDQYQPFCYFVMREPLPAGQRIQPGIFRIESVFLDETEVSAGFPSRVAVAGLLAMNGGWGPVALQSHMELVSLEQPDVRTLVCSGAFQSPSQAQPIHLPELRQVLGELVAVRVKRFPAKTR